MGNTLSGKTEKCGTKLVWAYAFELERVVLPSGHETNRSPTPRRGNP